MEEENIKVLNKINYKIINLSNDIQNLKENLKQNLIIDDNYLGKEKISEINNDIEYVSNKIVDEIIPKIENKIDEKLV